MYNQINQIIRKHKCLLNSWQSCLLFCLLVFIKHKNYFKCFIVFHIMCVCVGV